MADRGVDDDNPFSFKTFVGVKDKKVPRNANQDVDDIFGLSDAKPGSSKKGKQKDDPGSAAGSQKGTSKKDKQKENPFSFKKFLSSGSSSSTPKQAAEPVLPPVLDNACEIPLSLPNKSPQDNTLKSYLNGDPLHGLGGQIPISALPAEPIDCDLLANSLDFKSGLPDRSGLSSSEYRHLDLPEDIEGDPAQVLVSQNNASAIPSMALPDFLSDGAALNLHPAPNVESGTNFIRDNHDELMEQIRLLQEENDKLKVELKREKQRCSDKNQKLSQLKIDLERQKKKEAEETAVLERAVQQVEENLATTTKRAVQAESTVTKLKQDVKSLQSQVRTLGLENEAYKSGDGGLADIRERTKYTSDELQTAAAVAEKNIKELMAGVDKLKLLSQVLSSLEKVSDVSHDQSPEDSSKS